MVTTLRRSLVATLLVVSIGVLSRVSLHSQIVVADYMPPPPSIDALFKAARVVGRIQVTSETVRDLPEAGRGRGSVRTDYQVRVVEVMKTADPEVTEGANITVSLPIGEVVTSDGSRRQAVAAELGRMEVGAEYVVFLNKPPASTTYVPAYGPAGVFKFDRQSVVVPGPVRQWPEFEGRAEASRSAFLDKLRQLRDAR